MATLTWQQVNRRFLSEYPNILDLFDLIQTIPATSTACERGFSHMNLEKSDNRTRLTEESLCNSLMIKLEGPNTKDFDPLPAIDIWFTKVHHRPGTSGSRENKLDAAAAGISVLHDEDQTEREKGPTHEVNDADVNNPDVALENELVEETGGDSDYGSDYDSGDEDAEEVFNRLAKY